MAGNETQRTVGVPRIVMFRAMGNNLFEETVTAHRCPHEGAGSAMSRALRREDLLPHRRWVQLTRWWLLIAPSKTPVDGVNKSVDSCSDDRVTMSHDRC